MAHLLPAARLLRPVSRSAAPVVALPRTRPRHASSSSPPDDRGPGSGDSARTSEAIKFPYPADASSLRPSGQGGGRRAGRLLPTLGSFSLEGRVCVVTGGARGLGLVMGKGMVVSGADLAIVDLNGGEARRQAEAMTAAFREEHPEAER
jgi:D-arabinitol 2-dehydrogenase